VTQKWHDIGLYRQKFMHKAYFANRNLIECLKASLVHARTAVFD